MGDKGYLNLCLPCQKLPLAVSDKQKHAYMNVVAEHINKSGLTFVHLYRCYHCTALWSFEQDHEGSRLGFQLWPGDIESFQHEHSVVLAPASESPWSFRLSHHSLSLPPGSSWQ